MYRLSLTTLVVVLGCNPPNSLVDVAGLNPASTVDAVDPKDDVEENATPVVNPPPDVVLLACTVLVRDQVTGQPIPNASVRLEMNSIQVPRRSDPRCGRGDLQVPQPPAVVTMQTSAEGTFSIQNLEWATWSRTIVADGYQRLDVTDFWATCCNASDWTGYFDDGGKRYWDAIELRPE
ncbi:MAG: carboxypeptidase regulatory-like domain-containing protein [Myxococcales bacterium]|nr:carboxypeptidase regulatory-like domain-containing protein [Myxococcales bacterium]